MYRGHRSQLPNGAFLADTRSDDLMLIIRSFDMIIKQVELSNFTKETSNMFYRKLHIYYKSKLLVPMEILSEAFADSSDQIGAEIREFNLSMIIRLNLPVTER